MTSRLKNRVRYLFVERIMKLFTLLHLEEHERSVHNAEVKSFNSQIELYIGCTLNLKKSLDEQHIPLAVITNNKKLLLNFSGTEDLDVIELDFNLDVPSGIGFYSAHYKIEVFKYFATLQENYIGLIDNDMICINSLPLAFQNIIENQIPVYYDVTDQIHPAYSQTKIIKEKQLISSNNKIGLWAGGEFIAGSPKFFNILYNEIVLIKDQYFQRYKELHHQSDEFLTSVALENIILKNSCTIIDAGKLDIISRFWSVKTLHEQKKFNAFSSCFLLHLPADKLMLANAGHSNLSSGVFFINYLKFISSDNNIYNSFKRKLKKLFLL